MSIASPCYVFVYGTLRRGHTNAGRDVLTLHGSFLAEGTTPGCLYDLGAFPAMVDPERSGGDGHEERGQQRVHGEVYELTTEPQRGLARLDRYEGARGVDPLPYERRQVTVQLEDGDDLEAWTYVWTEDPGNAPRVEGGDWVDHVRSGDNP